MRSYVKKPGIHERETECKELGEWENVAKNFEECPQTFQTISSSIPGNVTKYSSECPQILQVMFMLLKEMRTQCQSKISSCCFCVWCKSRESGDRMNPRFPCVTPMVERFSSDLLRTIINYWFSGNLFEGNADKWHLPVNIKEEVSIKVILI